MRAVSTRYDEKNKDKDKNKKKNKRECFQNTFAQKKNKNKTAQKTTSTRTNKVITPHDISHKSINNLFYNNLYKATTDKNCGTIV